VSGQRRGVERSFALSDQIGDADFRIFMQRHGRKRSALSFSDAINPRANVPSLCNPDTRCDVQKVQHRGLLAAREQFIRKYQIKAASAASHASEGVTFAHTNGSGKVSICFCQLAPAEGNYSSNNKEMMQLRRPRK